MLEESPLSGDMKELERKHLIRTANEKKALRNVLKDFFKFENSMFLHSRCDEDIISYRDKSLKASKSAKKRWEKDANAVRTHSEGNANHKPITNNHKPITNKKTKGFIKPTITELVDAFAGKVTDSGHQAGLFLCHYESNGWKVGKNSMKSWQHAVTNWISRSKSNGTSKFTGQKVVSKSERRDEAARRYLEENNDDGVAWPASNEVSP
tara:strand:+ start:396 stop:1022 length:627 start_codon:yes stop_codon:yes gene_type:complete